MISGQYFPFCTWTHTCRGVIACTTSTLDVDNYYMKCFNINDFWSFDFKIREVDTLSHIWTDTNQVWNVSSVTHISRYCCHLTFYLITIWLNDISLNVLCHVLKMYHVCISPGHSHLHIKFPFLFSFWWMVCPFLDLTKAKGSDVLTVIGNEI